MIILKLGRFELYSVKLIHSKKLHTDSALASVAWFQVPKIKATFSASGKLRSARLLINPDKAQWAIIS